MAKFFAVTIIVIAIASAIPILRHTRPAPPDISVHGHRIHEQMSETMAEAGISFLAAQFILAIFIWNFSNRPKDGKSPSSRAKPRAWSSQRSCWWDRGSGPWSFWNQGRGACIFHPSLGRLFADSGASRPICVLFPVPGLDGKLGSLHAALINEANANFFGLDQTNDQDSKDDIVTAEMAIPVTAKFIC